MQSSDEEDSEEDLNDHENKYQSYPESMRVSSVQEKSFFENPVQVSSVYPVEPASVPNDKFTNPGQGPNEITTQTITNSTADVP